MTEDEYLEKWIDTTITLKEWEQNAKIDHWNILEQLNLTEEHLLEIEEHQSKLYYNAVENAVNYRIDKYKNRPNRHSIFKEHLNIINKFVNSIEYNLIINELLNTIIYLRRDDYIPVLLKMQDVYKMEFSTVRDDFNIVEINTFISGNYFTADILFKYSNKIKLLLDEKIEPVQETPPPKESETLSDLITHKNSVEIVEKIKIQYKNIKGKSLKLLLRAFQDLDLLPKERIASKFHKACDNEFNWNIASYNAMNGHTYNDVADKEELELKKSYLKSIIETK